MSNLFKKLKNPPIIATAILLSIAAAVFGISKIDFWAGGEVSAAELLKKFNSAPIEIKQSYKVESSALVIPAKDGNDIEISLGDRNSDKFLPNFEISKWEGEASLKINLASQGVKPTDVQFENEKIKFITPENDYHFYSHAPDGQNPEGAYEFDVVLKEKPESNKIEIPIETKNLNFYPKSYSASEQIPENLIGSYTAFISKINLAKHGTGKVFRIFRPKIIDAKGDWVWGELNIDRDLMAIAIPQKFLDEAAYPVTVDPNIGFLSDTNAVALYNFEPGALTTDSKGTNTLNAGSAPASDVTLYKQGVGSGNFYSNYAQRADSDLSSDFPMKNGTTNYVMSLAFWFRADAGGIDCLASKYAVGALSYAVWYNTDEKIQFSIGTSGGVQDIIHGTVLALSTWYHVTVTFNRTTKAVTIRVKDENGETVGTDIDTTHGGTDMYFNTEPFSVGAYGVSYPFDGRIDEFVVFKDILTADEATAIAEGTYGEDEGGDEGGDEGAHTIQINKSLTNFMNDDSLVGYWSFDGSAMGTNSATDLSGNSNTGWLQNGVKKAAGISGQALSFDGVNDNISMGDILKFTNAQAATISVWFNVASFAAGYQYLVSRITNTGLRGDYSLVIKNNTTLSYSYDNTIITEDAFFDWTVSQIQTNTWHNWVVILNTDDTVSGYYDGVSLDTKSLALHGDFSSTNFYLGEGTNADAVGNLPDGLFNDFNGLIDEVRIYNRVLSASEISDLYRVGAAKMQTNSPTTYALTDGLVGNWTFNGQDMDWGNSSAEALDRSGQENNGDVVNGAKPVIGKVGQALEFDGSDDNINVGDRDTLDFGTGNFSIVAWIKTISANTQYIVHKLNGNGLNPGYVFRTVNGRLVGKVNITGTEAITQSNETVNNGQWRFVVFSVSDRGTASGAKLFIDAVEATYVSQGNPAGTVTNSQKFYIGAADDDNNSVPEDFFDGLIDEARVYNRALSAEEVTQLYRLGARTAKPTQ